MLMTKPGFELCITRVINVPPARVWQVWTEQIEDWWAPKPWTTEIVALDLRPGGRSAMIMKGPDGETSPMEGIFLEVVPQRRIVTTDAFTFGWIPQKPFMVGLWEFEEDNGTTRYTARARHWDETAMQQHAAMGFTEGWSKVAEQLAELAEG